MNKKELRNMKLLEATDEIIILAQIKYVRFFSFIRSILLFICIRLHFIV